MSKQKEMRQIIYEAQLQGWRVEKIKNNHFKFIHSHGGIFYTASTASDHRAFDNIRNNIKKTAKVQNR